MEGYILELPNQDVNNSMTLFRGPPEPQDLTPSALISKESPSDLEADVALQKEKYYNFIGKPG